MRCHGGAWLDFSLCLSVSELDPRPVRTRRSRRREMVLGVLAGLLRRSGSHTPLGNFSSKLGNKNFYKGRGGRKFGVPGPRGAP